MDCLWIAHGNLDGCHLARRLGLSQGPFGFLHFGLGNYSIFRLDWENPCFCLVSINMARCFLYEDIFRVMGAYPNLDSVDPEMAIFRNLSVRLKF